MLVSIFLSESHGTCGSFRQKLPKTVQKFICSYCRLQLLLSASITLRVIGSLAEYAVQHIFGKRSKMFDF